MSARAEDRAFFLALVFIVAAVILGYGFGDWWLSVVPTSIASLCIAFAFGAQHERQYGHPHAEPMVFGSHLVYVVRDEWQGFPVLTVTEVVDMNDL